MSSRYDELERLQRLRESGALSDEEFQREKTRLLGQNEPAAVAEGGPLGEERPSRLPIVLIVAAAALILAVIAGLLLGRTVGTGGTDNGFSPEAAAAPERNRADANLIEAPAAAADVTTLPPAEQLAKAFETAFGQTGSASVSAGPGATDGAQTVTYRPVRLIPASFGQVLISEGRADNAAHVNAGRLAVHYLRPEGDRFVVARAFPGAVAAGSSGQVGKWSVSPRFSNWPVIVAQSGGTSGGYSCASIILTELRPDGPAQVANVPLYYDDKGAKGDAGGASTQGKIINVMKNEAFDAIYSGTQAFSEHYVRGPAGYTIAGGGKSRMQTC